MSQDKKYTPHQVLINTQLAAIKGCADQLKRLMIEQGDSLQIVQNYNGKQTTFNIRVFINPQTDQAHIEIADADDQFESLICKPITHVLKTFKED